MDKILLTGFEPFDGESVNPSWELVKTFDQKTIGNYQIISKQIPTVFYESAKVLTNYMKEFEPKIIICFGQAGGSKTIRLEKVAINLNDARITDNQGNQPIDETINETGSNAYFTKLPVRRILEALSNEEIPASISLSAGAYVCNHVFYHLLHQINNQDVIGGFIHIPYLDNQVIDKENIFSLNIETLQKALSIILELIVT